MRIKPFQAVYPNLDYITSASSFFETVKTEYNDYYNSGFFYKTNKDSVYIYQIQKKSRNYLGIIACADIRDYIEENIKRHENTLPTKEQKQIQLLLRRKATVKPILLTYPQVPEIGEWITYNLEGKKPFFEVEFEEAKQKHVFWEVKDEKQIQLICQLFAEKVPTTYIADGHHRTSSIALLNNRGKLSGNGKPYDTLLTAFFPSTELEILDFNRIIEGLEDITLSTFMAKISQLFDIEVLEKAEKPQQKHEITMFVNKEWFKLKWRKEVLDEYGDSHREMLLDANLLNEKVMGDILGIPDVRTDPRITYVEGPKGLEGIRKKTIKKSDSVAFCLYPVQLEDLLAVSDAGRVMPPKSTWFEPRIKNGLIVQEF